MPDANISGYSQLRDARRIHLANRDWEQKTATAHFTLLCGQKRALLKIIDPIYHEKFGWNGMPQQRCAKCLEVVAPKPKKGVA